MYNTLVIHHGNCPDGVCAAWVVTRFAPYPPVKLHGTNERVLSQDKDMPSFEKKHVFIVDYSYPFETLKAIASSALSLTVFDHHQSAEKDIKAISQLENGKYDFDIKRCGAVIAWDAMALASSKPRPRPWFLEHIQDRDLWLWNNPASKAFSAALRQLPLNVETFEMLMQQPNGKHMYTQGNKRLEFEKWVVDSLVENRTWVKCQDMKVIALATSIFVSECGHRLLELEPEAQFALIYQFDVQKRVWRVSLRARKGQVDVSKVAQKFGGGGHPAAAGFTCSNLLDLFY